MGKNIRRILSLVLGLLMVLGSAQLDKILPIKAINVAISEALPDTSTWERVIKYESEVDGGSLPVKWDASLFKEPATTYNYDLALVAAGLNAAASGNGEKLFGENGAYKELGFSFIKYYNYDYDGSEKAVFTNEYGDHQKMNEHCFSMASQLMTIDGREQLVIAVVLRGTESGDEGIGDLWANADIDFIHGKKVFNYFYEYEEKVYNKFSEYLNSTHQYYMALPFVTLGGIKVLIAGHSLGGAAANLFAARLNDSDALITNNVYAYTFGALNSIGRDENKSAQNPLSGFNNICNFFNKFDTFGPNGDGYIGSGIFGDGGRIARGEKPAFGNDFYDSKYGPVLVFENDYIPIKKNPSKAAIHYKNHIMECYIDALRRILYVDQESSTGKYKDMYTLGPGGKEVSALEDYGYASVLEEYRQAVVNANYNEYAERIFNWEPLFDCSFYLDDESAFDYFGYAYRDLNDDQQPELLLMSNEFEIYAIYTMIDGKTFNFFGPYGRIDGDSSLCYLNSDNTITIAHCWSESTDYEKYKLSDSGNEKVNIFYIGGKVDFVPIEGAVLNPLYHYAENDDEMYRVTSFYIIDETGKEILISEEEYINKSPREFNNLINNANSGLTFIPLFDSQHEAASYAKTPSPATTLLPVLAYPTKVAITNKQTVNIRSGPGTSWPQIGEAYPGVNFYFTGTTDNDFYEIIYPNIKNNPQYGRADGSGSYDLYVTAYVKQSLATTSQTTADDVILSSLIGNLEVKANTQIYLDENLKQKSKGSFADNAHVPFAGVASSGAYAVLFNRTNDKGEQVLWIGFIASEAVVSESRLSE